MAKPKRHKNQLWNRLPGESTRAYHKFITYLKLGPTRTMRATGEALGAVDGVNGVKRHYDKFQWKQRAEAYDVYLADRDIANHEEKRDGITERLFKNAHNYVETIENLSQGICDLGETDDKGAPIVKPSVRLQAAKAGLELAGFVPPRRAEPIGKDDGKEAARAVVKSMDAETLAKLFKALEE